MTKKEALGLAALASDTQELAAFFQATGIELTIISCRGWLRDYVTTASYEETSKPVRDAAGNEGACFHCTTVELGGIVRSSLVNRQHFLVVWKKVDVAGFQKNGDPKFDTHTLGLLPVEAIEEE